MPAIFFPIILTFLILCGSKGVLGGEFPGPRNVRMTSFNMDLVLMWDPPENGTSGLVYRAEYNTVSVSGFKVCCLNTTAHSCNLTSPQILVSVFGTYAGRVRAELGGERSAWVESGPITMDEHTTIGRPVVALIPNGAQIEVSIQDPVFRIPRADLRNTYSYVAYNISYWKKIQVDMVQNISSQQTRLVLSDLEPRTIYCVKVQIYINRKFKASQASDIICESAATEDTPWVVAVVTSVVMVMVVAVVVLVVVYHRKMTYFLCPKDSLPQMFKEQLLERPHSSIYLAMQESLSSPEEIYDKVSSIMPGERTEQELPLQARRSNCSTQEDRVMVLKEDDEREVKT